MGASGGDRHDAGATREAPDERRGCRVGRCADAKLTCLVGPPAPEAPETVDGEVGHRAGGDAGDSRRRREEVELHRYEPRSAKAADAELPNAIVPPGPDMALAV